MRLRLLLDTHIVIRWLAEPRKLSREQLRALEDTVRRTEPVAFSAISLLEIADRAIVATARVHSLKLVTSDQRIIESNAVSVVE